jgi:hypothetical protein
MLQLGFGRIVTTIPRRFIDRCRNVDFSRTSNAQFLYPYLKSCALHPESRLCRNREKCITVILINMKAMYFAASVDRLTGEGGRTIWNTSQWTYIRSIPGRE